MEDNNPIRVAVIDDDMDFTRQLISYLKQSPKLKFIGAAHTKEDGLMLAESTEIDVFLLDISLDKSDKDGIDILKKIRKIGKSKVIMLSSMLGEEYVGDSALYGAADFMDKSEYYCLEDRVTQVLEKRIAYVKDFTTPFEKVFRMFGTEKREKMLKELSPAEREVFDLRVKGYKLDEIAQKLHKEPGTIKNQNNSMLRRYKCHSFEELMDKLGYEPRH